MSNRSGSPYSLPREANRVPLLGAASTADGITPVVLEADPTTHALKISTSPSTTATATLTNVTSSASSVLLLASNVNRKMAMFYNDSTSTLYLKLGVTASTTSYTVQLQAGGYYELPSPIYTGEIDGIWSAANGAVRITEL